MAELGSLQRVHLPQRSARAGAAVTEARHSVSQGNCFPWIEDIEAAPQLLDAQLQSNWTELRNGLALRSCPALSQVLRPLRPEYYWSANETEGAPDLRFRSPADDARRPASWQPMRKGVSDGQRRCALRNQCNARYAEALASAQLEEKLKEVVTPACNRVRKDGKSYRGLNPWQEQDYQLLKFLAQGQKALNGFRNKDLRRWLYPQSDDADQQERRR